jgi:hypothetical protein
MSPRLRTDCRRNRRPRRPASSREIYFSIRLAPFLSLLCSVQIPARAQSRWRFAWTERVNALLRRSYNIDVVTQSRLMKRLRVTTSTLKRRVNGRNVTKAIMPTMKLKRLAIVFA